MDTLFRGNSIACKVLSLSFKTFGLYYLQSVVRPLIIQLMKCNDKDFEVDPARLTDPEKLQRNQLNLLELVQMFYTTILSSLPSLPLQLRTVCHMLFTVCLLECYILRNFVIVGSLCVLISVMCIALVLICQESANP